jgi:hypothetical protein
MVLIYKLNIDDYRIHHQMLRLGVVEYHLLLKYFL